MWGVFVPLDVVAFQILAMHTCTSTFMVWHSWPKPCRTSIGCRMYSMQCCEEMVSCFTAVLLVYLITIYLPLRTVKRHTTDKPWVTDKFRRLIYGVVMNALTSGDTASIQAAEKSSSIRLTRQLRQKYYEKKVTVKGLRNSNPHNWSRADVKQITGLKPRSTEPLVGLVQRLHGGDMHALAGHINKFFQQVAADLHPLSDSASSSWPWQLL